MLQEITFLTLAITHASYKESAPSCPEAVAAPRRWERSGRRQVEAQGTPEDSGLGIPLGAEDNRIVANPHPKMPLARCW